MTITQEEALEVLNTDLDYLDYDAEYPTLSYHHQRIMDEYLESDIHSLDNINSVIEQLTHHICLSAMFLRIPSRVVQDYIAKESAHFKQISTTSLRLCIFQMLAKSIILETLTHTFIDTHNLRPNFE